MRHCYLRNNFSKHQTISVIAVRDVLRPEVYTTMYTHIVLFIHLFIHSFVRSFIYIATRQENYSANSSTANNKNLGMRESIWRA